MQTSGARSREPGASEKQKRPKWRCLDSDLAVIDRIAAADTIGQSYGQPTTRHDVEMLLTIHTLARGNSIARGWNNGRPSSRP